MKKVAMIILVILIFAVTGCDSTQQSETGTPTVSASDGSLSTLAPTENEAQKTSEEYYEAMVERSLTSIGNPTRIKAKIEQAKSGKKTVIAYIGGSITEGYAGGAEGCYAKLSYNYFAEAYGTGENVEYVNAGLSGTASTVGNLRVQRDVLAYKPDIVFIEYAVNDSQDLFTKLSYESLVKTLLMQENEPAVVLLFNRTIDGYSAQEYMKTIGEHYSLPMISVVDAITLEIDKGRMKWEDFSVDEAHPGTDGHKLISEFIEHMYRTAEDTSAVPYEIPDNPIFGTQYVNAAMATLTMPNEAITVTDTGSFKETTTEGNGFPGYWEYTQRSAGEAEPIKLTARGSAFFLIYKTNNSEGMGSVNIYVNGELVKIIYSDQEYGWGGPAASVAVEFDEVKDMEIEICPSEDETGRKVFTLYGFAVVQN